MTEPRTVYVVLTIDYDSSEVDGVFERREDADAAVAAGFGVFVQECRLYPAGHVPRREGRQA